jgi:hypothetical protein
MSHSVIRRNRQLKQINLKEVLNWAGKFQVTRRHFFYSGYLN